MGRKNRKPLIEGLAITEVAAEGMSLGKQDGIVVFVTDCIPGDVVDVQVVRKRKRYMEGFPVKFRTRSPIRIEPFCSHFGVCGGCKWQHLPYDHQLAAKEKWVRDSLERIGKVDPGTIHPVLGSDKRTGYRNKLEFTFSNSRWLTRREIETGDTNLERRALGFHIPGKFDKVLDIDQCYLQPEPSNAVRNFVRQYAREKDLDFFDLVRQEGLLRNLIIRNNLAGEVMVIFSFFRNDGEAIRDLLNLTADNYPQITSLMYVINPKANDTLQELDLNLFRGKDHLIEQMDGLQFRISPKSFFQTNPTQALHLYRIVLDWAALTGRETVYDLYTGTGTIALFLARHCKKVIGIEYVEDAIDDAIQNAALNGIGNTAFFAGDIRRLLQESFFNEHGFPDVLVTDPPRTGMHEDVIRSILSTAPRRIVYVSCNPATQARDLKMLDERYRVTACQPVDMFPHTHHVENVALLVLRDF
jgi:23S rRNA (uracil1939-C5)-methyltransferase